MKKSAAFTFIAALLTLTVVVSTPAFAAPTSITNGDFETEAEQSSPNTIPGWTKLNQRIDLGTTSIAGCTSVDTSDYSNLREWYAESGKEYFPDVEVEEDANYYYYLFVNWDTTITSATVNADGTEITYTASNTYQVGDFVTVDYDNSDFNVDDAEVTASTSTTFTVADDFGFISNQTNTDGGRSYSDDYVTASGLLFGFRSDDTAFLQTSLQSARIFEENWTSAQRAAVLALIRNPAVANDSLVIPWSNTPEFNVQVDTDESNYVEFSSNMNGDGDVNLNGLGYVVHGPALFSEEFSAKTVDDLSFRYAASDEEDDYKVFGYLLNTADCTQTEVLDSNGEGQEWTTVTVAIPSNGTYRFVFVSGTYDQNWGSAAGALMFLDDATLAPNAERVADELARTGASFDWLLGTGLVAIIGGLGLVALGRRKRTA